MRPLDDTVRIDDETSSGLPIEDDAKDVVLKYYELCRDQRQTELEDKWDKYWRLEKGEYKKTDNEDNERKREGITSKIFIKLCKAAGKAAHSAVMRALIPTDEQWFDIAAHKMEMNDTDPVKAMMLKELLQNMYYQQKRKRQISSFVNTLKTYGTAFAKMTPKKRVSKNMRAAQWLEPDMMTGEFKVNQQVMMDEIKATRPEFENIDIRNVYVDQYATSVHDAQGVIIRSIISKSEYKKLVKDGIYNEIKDLSEKSYTGDDDYKDERLQAKTGSQIGNKGVEILEYWGLFNDEEFIITVVNGEYIGRMEGNPYWNKCRPIIHAVWEEDPFMIYGTGVPEACEGSQSAINALWRAKIDNFARINNAIYELDITKLYNPTDEDFGVYSGKLFKTRGGGALTPHYPQNITNDNYEIQALERYIQEETNVPKLLSGQTTSGSQTATEVEAQLSNINLNIAEIVERLEQDLIIPMLRYDYEMIAQYMEDFEIVNLVGDLGQVQEAKINRYDIIGNYDFKALGTSGVIAKTIHNNQIINFRNAFQDLNADWAKLARQFFQNLGMKGVDEILPEGGVVPVQAIQRAAGVMSAARLINPDAVNMMMQLASDPQALAQQEQHLQQQQMNQGQMEAANVG